MKKNFVALGCAGLLCCFGIIISCGQGVVDPLNDEFNAKHDIIDQGLISFCFSNDNKSSEDKEFCEKLVEEVCTDEDPCDGGWEEPSSDSESSSDSGSESSSSSYEPSSNSGTSSSSSNRPSSSSEGTPSSSSVSTPSSSTGGGGGGGKADCGDLSPGDIDFKCEWSRALVVSGKKTTPTINILKGDNGNCTSNISYLYAAGFGSCEVAFNDGTEYSTGAEDRLKTIGCQGDLEYFSWPVPTDSKDEKLDVKASVTCGNSCKQVECPLTITSSPKPDVSGDINCDWPLLSGNGTNKYLSIGAELPNCTGSVTVKNPGEDEANCGKVTYENEGSTSSAGKVYGRAVATCSGSKKTLKEYEATVVPNPSLSGSCSWEKNPVKALVGATPGGDVALQDSYGRCGSLKDGALTSSSFVAEGISKWPVTVAGTYDVKTNITCTPEIEQKSCPKLEVIDGADYMIECNGGIDENKCGGKDKDKAILKVDECAEIVVKWTESSDLPNVIMRCEVSGSQNMSYTLTLNGKAEPTVTTSQWSAQSQVALGKIKVGENELGTLCLKSVSGTNEVKCTIGR